MNHLVNANKMVSDTPRTDAEVNRPHGPLDGIVTIDADFACMLERELNAANERIKNLESALSTVENIDKVNAYKDLESANERIKRLEELLWLSQPVCEAKEAKP